MSLSHILPWLLTCMYLIMKDLYSILFLLCVTLNYSRYLLYVASPPTLDLSDQHEPGAIWDKHRVPSSGQSWRPGEIPRAGSRGSAAPLPSPFSPKVAGSTTIKVSDLASKSQM